MKQLTRLHEEFIDASRRPMTFGRLPIDPRRVELPIVPMDRWVKEGDPKVLTKTYRFRRPNDRNVMVRELLTYEEEVGHCAKLVLDEETLRVELITRDIKSVTELDKEYAAFADQVYKEICLVPDRDTSMPEL